MCFMRWIGELAVASSEARSWDELFGSFADGVAEAASADFVQLLEYVAEEELFILRAGPGLHGDFHEGSGWVRVPSGLLSQAGRAMLDPEGLPVALEDFSSPHDWADDDLLRGHGARSGISVKVEGGVGDFGAIGAFYAVPRCFTSEERGFLALAAALLGSGVKRLGQREQAAAWRSRAELLRSGSELLKFPAEKDDLLTAAVSAVINCGGAYPIADWCFADALTGDGRFSRLERVAVGCVEGAAEHLEEAFSAPLSPSAPHGAPRAYATRQTELVRRVGSDLISDIAKDATHLQAIEEARPCSYICAPVIGAGRFHGAITLLRTETGIPTPFDDEDRDAVSEFAALVGYAIEMELPEAGKANGAPEPDPSTLDAHLTPREYEVLSRIALGKRLKQIGREFSISEHTVRSHKLHICQKLGLTPSDADTKIIAEAERRGVSNLRP